MDYQAGGLVDEREVLILEHDGERDGGWLKSSGRLVVRELNCYDLTPLEEPGSPSDFSADGGTLVRNQAGRLGPGDCHLIGEKPVEALCCGS
jgi:hypothetical protein